MLNHTKYSDLTPEQYELLGKAFIEWSNIEFLLGVLLSRLLFTPEFLGRTYSDEMSAAKLESAIKNALEIHRSRYHGSVISKEMDAKVMQLMSKAATCRILRNKFAHFLWMRSSDNEIFGAKMSGKLPTPDRSSESVVVSVEELKTNYATAHALAEDMKRIILEIPKIEEERNLTSKSSRPPSSAAD